MPHEQRPSEERILTNPSGEDPSKPARADSPGVKSTIPTNRRWLAQQESRRREIGNKQKEIDDKNDGPPDIKEE